jgi:hypothetical protein
MNARWWTIPAVLLALTAGSCSSFGTPKALSNEPLGGPCLHTADCATGLTCFSFQLDPQGHAWEGGNLCTVACANGGTCPSGTTCVDPSGAPSSVTQSTADSTGPICVPTCSTGTDCQQGGRAGACVALNDGTKVCEELNCVAGDSACTKPNCDACPASFSCVAADGQYAFCEK